jgi:lipoprotein NlpI
MNTTHPTVLKLTGRAATLLLVAMLGIMSAVIPASATAQDDLVAGRAALNTEQPGEAVRLFTQAIDSAELTGSSELSTAYYFRAVANRTLGAYDAAVADFSQTISLTPEADYAYGDRGVAYFALGRFSEAAADFDMQIQLGGVNGFSALWRYVASARGGNTSTELLAQDAAQLDLGVWPGMVIDLFLGSGADETVRAAAQEGSEDMQAFRSCVAEFYIGEKSLMRGDTGAARAQFEQALVKCPMNSQIYAAANAELAQLKMLATNTATLPPAPPLGSSTPATTPQADTSFFDPNAATYPSADDTADATVANLFERVDWASLGTIDLVFLPTATVFKQLFLEADLLLYWGIILAAGGLLLWFVIRPFMGWIGRNILRPIVRFMRRIGVFIGRVLVVALMAYLALMGVWTLAVEQDWLNGSGLLAGFGLLTFVTARHFLAGGSNDLFDVSMQVKDLADEYAEIDELAESL